MSEINKRTNKNPKRFILVHRVKIVFSRSEKLKKINNSQLKEKHHKKLFGEEGFDLEKSGEDRNYYDRLLQKTNVINNKINELTNSLENFEKRSIQVSKSADTHLGRIAKEIVQKEKYLLELDEKNKQLCNNLNETTRELKFKENSFRTSEEKNIELQNFIEIAKIKLSKKAEAIEAADSKYQTILTQIDVSKEALADSQSKAKAAEDKLASIYQEIEQAKKRLDQNQVQQESESIEILQLNSPEEIKEDRDVPELKSEQTIGPDKISARIEQKKLVAPKVLLLPAPADENLSDQTEKNILKEVDKTNEVILIAQEKKVSKPLVKEMPEKDRLLRVMRTEKKYLISMLKSISLSGKLDKVLWADPHNGTDGYLVRSLYFDSIDDRDYYEKEDGLLQRKKIRLRVYSPSDIFVKLEKKEKFGNDQCKRSLNISRETANLMIRGIYEPLNAIDHPFAQEIYLDLTTGGYLPKCLIEYQRKAFIVPENDTRITFDSNIRSSEVDFNIFTKSFNGYPVSHNDDVTLEVKYNNFLLSYVKDLLASCHKTQISNGKYYLGRSIGHGKMNIYL